MLWTGSSLAFCGGVGRQQLSIYLCADNVNLCFSFRQVCSATSRVLVHKSIREKLISLLLEKVAAVKIGNSLDPAMIAESEAGKPTMGPLVSRGQWEKVWAFIDEAKSQRLTFAYGGERGIVASLGKGYFVPPTVS